MTAEKIANDCKRWISEEDFEYVFHPDKFYEFCKQLSKEQRENCAFWVDENAMALRNAILESREPEFK